MKILLAMLAVVNLVLVACSDTEYTYTCPNGTPQSGTTTSMPNGEQCTGCDDGYTLTSNNTCIATGTYWTSRYSSVGSYLYDVHYANGLWVAVGLYGEIITSP